eukprot:4815600-Heterocapsa_arctica.AAC.1
MRHKSSGLFASSTHSGHIWIWPRENRYDSGGKRSDCDQKGIWEQNFLMHIMGARWQAHIDDAVLAQTRGLGRKRIKYKAHGGNGKSLENRNGAGSGFTDGQAGPYIQDTR